MSFTKYSYHLVFPTKERAKLILPEVEREVYAIIYNLCRDKNAYVWRIGGMPDHVHLLVDVPAIIPMADFVKYVKSKTTQGIKEQSLIPQWQGWSEGYGGFTVSHKDVEAVRAYIMNQKQHHKKVSFRDEYAQWLEEHGISKDNAFFPK